MKCYVCAYGSQENFDISQKNGIFGAKDSNDGRIAKFNKLEKGDIVFIQNSSNTSELVFFGYCEIKGYKYQIKDNNPKNFLWEDEKRNKEVIYSHRIEADFNNGKVDIQKLKGLKWGNFTSLGWENKKGKLLDLKGIKVTFGKSNFIEFLPAKEIFENLLIIQDDYKAVDIEESSSTERSQIQISRIIRDTAMTQKLKIKYDFLCQICGETLEIGQSKKYVEAHHVKPLGHPHNGPDIESNLISVCPNHHAMLDYAAMSLNKQMFKVNLHYIADEFIEYHNNLFEERRII